MIENRNEFYSKQYSSVELNSHHRFHSIKTFVHASFFHLIISQSVTQIWPNWTIIDWQRETQLFRSISLTIFISNYFFVYTSHSFHHAVIVSIADTRSMIIIDKEKSRKITVIVIITDLDDLIVVIQTNIINTRKPDTIDRPDHFLLWLVL